MSGFTIPLLLRSIIGLLALAIGAEVAQGQFPGMAPGGENEPGSKNDVTASDLVTVEAAFDAAAMEAGETAELVITFKIKPDWHVYWKNPGEGAMPPHIEVTGPHGFEIGEIRWPRPIRVASPVGDMFCYEGDAAFLVPVTRLTERPASGGGGTAELNINLAWAVCDKDRCLIGQQSLQVPIRTDAPDGSLEPQPVRVNPAAFPKALKQVEGAKISFDGSVLRIRGPIVGDGEVSLFPNPPAGISYNAVDIRTVGDQFEIDISVMLETELLNTTKPVLGGLIAMGPHRDDPSFEFSLPIEIPEQN